MKQGEGSEERIGPLLGVAYDSSRTVPIVTGETRFPTHYPLW